MRLKHIEIKNFRSIKNIKIDFDSSCRVLVGINESGKSNILNALAFLSENHKPVRKDDLREALHKKEEEIKEAYIRFIFKFEKNESDKLIKSISSKILSKEKDPHIISVDGKNQRISDVCNAHSMALYVVDILNEKKHHTYYKLKDDCSLLKEWKKISDSQTGSSIFIGNRFYEISGLQHHLIRAGDYPETQSRYLKDAKIKDFEELYGQAVIEIAKENLPKALFWKYNENNFLPKRIEIAEFSKNPDSFTPLKNMFSLAKIKDIKEYLEKAREGSDNQFQNRLDSIAEKTTQHFRTVWKDYKNVKFSLKLNGDQINPGIKEEENVYDFVQRSDGFKRFVTFLLTVSANIETNKICNSLLLIDEPGIGLHPSAAGYLRDELLRISEENYVVYSTHSIFMIDNENIKRHYIVKKENEITSIESAEESSIADEEVLYKALGYSVFSVLGEKNLIFEGWKDKHLFRIVLENAEDGLAKRYEDVRTAHIKGVRMAKDIAPLIELANRKCLIVSDSDEAAKKEKKKYEEGRGFVNWKTYQDIDPSIEAITGEDFIKNDFIAEQVNAVLLGNKTLTFDESVLPDKKNKLSAIRKWLEQNTKMTTGEISKMVKEIKDSIFDNLKYENIEIEEYFKLFKGISFS